MSPILAYRAPFSVTIRFEDAGMTDEPLAFLAEAFGGDLDPALEFELQTLGDPESSDGARLGAVAIGPPMRMKAPAPGL